jgi:hypothetical protein
VKAILRDSLSPRWGYQGWVIEADGNILDWTFSTTREECRELLASMRRGTGQLFRTRYRIVKANVKVEEAFK